MLPIPEEMIENMKYSLNYIIEKDLNVNYHEDQTEEESDYIEDLDYKYLHNGCERYTIYIDGEKYVVDCCMKTEDALFVIENIPKIEYLYFDAVSSSWDTVIGNIKNYFNGNFEKRIRYKSFVANSVSIPNINEINKLFL